MSKQPKHSGTRVVQGTGSETHPQDQRADSMRTDPADKAAANRAKVEQLVKEGVLQSMDPGHIDTETAGKAYVLKE